MWIYLCTETRDQHVKQTQLRLAAATTVAQKAQGAE